MSSAVLRRWALLLVLVAWGLGYIAWFAHLVAQSRDFIASERMEAVCSAARQGAPTREMISFSRPGVDRNMLLAGWGWPEDWGVWTTARQARLVLPTPPATEEDLWLVLDLLAPVNHRISEIHLRLALADGEPVDWDVGLQRQDARHYLAVPASLVRGRPCVELRIDVVNPYRPILNRLGRDGRLLGIGLRRAGWISASELGPAQTGQR